MPELPEVESIKLGLERVLCPDGRHLLVESVELRRADIRFPIPKELPQRLAGRKWQGVRRRAKYLLFDLDDVILLSHLGMTGSWRFFTGEMSRGFAPGIHDHCLIHFKTGELMVFRDPRRFGLLDLVEVGQEKNHVRLHDLGPEPLDENVFSGDSLFSASRGRKVPIKSLLMDQRIVVGIGNIYASEALFRAGVKPTKLAAKITHTEAGRIVRASRAVLLAAIKAGGSTIRDYSGSSGEKGDFQSRHRVYERAGQACAKCGAVIKTKVISGRSTYWCPTCQS